MTRAFFSWKDLELSSFGMQSTNSQGILMKPGLGRFSGQARMLVSHYFRVRAKKEGFREIMLCKWQKGKRKHWG